jgi:MFS family permease
VVNSAGGLAWIYLALYLVGDRGMTPGAAGVVAACYGAGLIAGNFAGGWFGDRFGLRRGLLVSQLSWIVACLGVPLAPTSTLALLVGAAGVCSGASRPLSFALVAAALPSDRRREGMALSRTASNLGFTIGPPLGALLAAYDFNLIFVLDAASSAVLAAIVWRAVPRDAARPAAPTVPGPAAPTAPTVQGVPAVPASGTVWARLRRDPSVLAILGTVLVVDTVYRQILTPLPLMLRAMGQPAVAYGLLMAANAALIVAFEAPIAVRLSDRAALPVISVGYALVGAGYLVIGVAPGLATAAVAIAVLTAGEMLYKPTAPAYVADAAPAGMLGRYQSLYGAASIGGMMLAPALGGFGYQYAGDLIWPICAVVGGLSAFALWRVGRRDAPVPVPA